MTATAVLKSAFLLDAGLPSVAFQGFDFIFLLFVFRVGLGTTAPLWGGVMLCTVSVLGDLPASWLDLGALGNAGDCYTGQYATF